MATSNMGIFLYASGFFAAGTLMRSFLSVAPTMLPALALLIYLKQKKTDNAHQLKHRRNRYRRDMRQPSSEH